MIAYTQACVQRSEDTCRCPFPPSNVMCPLDRTQVARLVSTPHLTPDFFLVPLFYSSLKYKGFVIYRWWFLSGYWIWFVLCGPVYPVWWR